MNNIVENNKDSTISDIPIITGIYVQPMVIPCEVPQEFAPLGRDSIDAKSLPFAKPIKNIKLQLKNKKIIIIIAFLVFSADINIPLSFLVALNITHPFI